MSVSLIVALDRNGLIGLGGTLPWHRPADLRNFKEITTGHIVVMGRKTYESIGNKPLPGRVNIVFSKRKFGYIDGVYHTDYHSDISIIAYDEVFIIGGMHTYKSFAPYIERMYITVIDQKTPVPDGTEATYFPWTAFANTSWQCIEQRMLGPDHYFVYNKVIYGDKKTQGID